MRNLLHFFPKPSRYAGIEDGACRKNPADVRLTVALAFPDTYDVGMSYLGQKILYGVVNSNRRWQAERVMAPEREAAAVLRARNAPLCTLETDTPLAKTDCVAFSVTHELCYTNILYMLDLAGVPLRTADRPQSLADCPLVIAGGGALLSAEPLAPFVDVMVLGDGEESLPDLLCLLEKARVKVWPRMLLLEEARHIPGIYVPSLFTDPTTPDGPPYPLFADHARPARRVVANLDTAPYPTQQITPVGAVHNRLSLEIARGCTRGCRFCHAGMVYRPVRERSLPNILTLLRDCLTRTGFDEISFLSLSAGDFSALKGLCLSTLDHCAAEQISLCLPSLRVGSVDDEILERMADLRRTGVTLAPEAGSQRLRDVINKGVTEETLLLHAQKLLEHGWRRVKLYFMIGLPTETFDDLDGIAALAARIMERARSLQEKGRRNFNLTVSVSNFVPKPHTPFQWVKGNSEETLKEKMYYLKDRLRTVKGVNAKFHDTRVSAVEMMLSKGDRRTFRAIKRAWELGCRFDSWREYFDYGLWTQAFSETGIPIGSDVYADPAAPLPWDIIDTGTDKELLYKEYMKAYETHH